MVQSVSVYVNTVFELITDIMRTNQSAGDSVQLLALGHLKTYLPKAHANGRNIVGPNMLPPFAWNHDNVSRLVGTCCV